MGNLKESITAIKAVFAEFEKDVEKFEKGNDTAGKRVRKHCMDMKNLAGEIRKEVQEQRNNK